MGAETKTVITVEGRQYRGLLQQEGDFVLFRGEGYRLKILLDRREIWSAANGELRARLEGGVVSFALGAAAEKWLERIRNPRSRLDKLGVKAEHQVAVIGIREAGFGEELAERLNTPATSRLKQNLDVVFLGVETPEGLGRIAEARKKIQPQGSVWVVYPKGSRVVTQAQVLEAIRTAGLVDVKVAAFSSTQTALKAVIPLAERKNLH